MKKIFLLCLISLSPFYAHAAVAYDNSAIGSVPIVSGTGYSYTTSGTNRILLIGLATPGSTDNISGVTYGGVSMTRYNRVVDATNYSIYLYYLINPTSGANNYVVTGSGTIYGQVASYNGVSQVSFPDAGTTNQSTGTSQTTTLTTVADNAWTFAFFEFNVSQTGTPAAGVGTTIRQSQFSIFYTTDSNGAITPAGSTSLGLTNGSNTQNSSIMVSLAPVATLPVYSWLSLVRSFWIW
jgi:hypothetical protein